jgi:hypothetical protein
MIRSGKILSAVFAMATMFCASAAVQADTFTELHMDINSVTITAFNPTTGKAGFGGLGWSGELQFSTNSNTVMGMDIDGITGIGYNGSITSMSGDLTLAGGFLSGGAVTIDVKDASGNTDAYSYDIIANTGLVTRPLSPLLFTALGYSLEGATDNGAFTNADYAGVNVQTWKQDEPLFGDFFQFHYRPNAVTGVDNNADIDLFVIADETTSGAPPSTPLPGSLAGGLVGLAGLAGIRWIRRSKMI